MEYKYKTLLELEKKRQFLNNSSFINSLLSFIFIILFLVLIVIFYGQYFNYKDKIFLFILIILAVKLLFSTSKELRTNKSKDFNKEFKNYFLKPYLEKKVLYTSLIIVLKKLI